MFEYHDQRKGEACLDTEAGQRVKRRSWIDLDLSVLFFCLFLLFLMSEGVLSAFLSLHFSQHISIFQQHLRWEGVQFGLGLGGFASLKRLVIVEYLLLAMLPRLMLQ